jgi:hypothetical protein
MLNMYYVCIRLLDFLHRILRGLTLVLFPLALPEEPDMEYLEIRGTRIQIHSSPIQDTLFEEIDEFDYSFQMALPVSHMYYIGSYVYFGGEWIMGSAISPPAFYEYSEPALHHYLVGYHVSPMPEQTIHVLQILEPHPDAILGTAYFYHLPVVIKTYWIRIVQRTWARVYRERMRVLQMRKSLDSLAYFERTGKYPEGYRNLPGLIGMLSYI